MDDRLKKVVQNRFEKWAYIGGHDLQKNWYGMYCNQRTQSAFMAYVSATNHAMSIVKESIAYYQEGSLQHKTSCRILDEFYIERSWEVE